ncbi:MAG: YihY/virulence factor BrkB family protein [Proteobacteria bacterium]|nr:YihY/virulence factor BrkB family protein [Pseudomonadota bacterium]MBU1711350.1 YihY/virulence factor BrkB family protein [Pseudomonadota bacterium]
MAEHIRPTLTCTEMTKTNQSGKSDKLFDRLSTWIWLRTGADEPLWKRTLRALLKIYIIIFHECKKDRISLRASSLTFTVVLSLVPMLAMGTAILKGLGSGDEMRNSAYIIIERISGSESSLITADPGGTSIIQTPDASLAAEDENGGKNLKAHLHDAVDKIFDYVDRTNFATIGAVGVFTLVIAVAMMLNSIEQAMNDVWQAHSARSLGRMIVDYLALIILLPLTINLAFFIEASLETPALHALLKTYVPLAELVPRLMNFLPISLVILTFTILYSFLPNTRVKLFPAMIGGITGGLGWFLTQNLYVKMQIGVARYNAIYGSFATLPLFLLWIYAGWIVFLFGAEMAFAVQIWRRYIPGKAALNPAQKLALAFNIIDITARDFNNRKLTFLPDIAQQLMLPDPHVKQAMDELVTKGILRRVKDRELGYCPATHAERIKPSEVVDIILGEAEPSTQGGEFATKAVNGARTAMANDYFETITLQNPKETK